MDGSIQLVQVRASYPQVSTRHGRMYMCINELSSLSRYIRTWSQTLLVIIIGNLLNHIPYSKIKINSDKFINFNSVSRFVL